MHHHFHIKQLKAKETYVLPITLHICRLNQISLSNKVKRSRYTLYSVKKRTRINNARRCRIQRKQIKFFVLFDECVFEQIKENKNGKAILEARGMKAADNKRYRIAWRSIEFGRGRRAAFPLTIEPHKSAVSGPNMAASVLTVRSSH